MSTIFCTSDKVGRALKLGKLPSDWIVSTEASKIIVQRLDGEHLRLVGTAEAMYSPEAIFEQLQELVRLTRGSK